MRFVILDLIRILAVLSIVVFHVGNVTRPHFVRGVFGLGQLYEVSLGGIGVTVLLILSGLVLELKYRSRLIGYGHFVRQRILRIYPTYYLALLLGMVLYFARKYYYTGHLSYPNSVYDLIGSLTGYYAFLGRWGGPFVGTSWFIGPIMSMYLMYPYLAKGIRNHPHVVISLLFLTSVVFRTIFRQYGYFDGSYGSFLWRARDWFPLCRIFEFSLGAYLANVMKEKIWSCMNGTGKGKSIVEFIAGISFPMFLVHYPLLVLIPFLSNRGLHQWVAVTLYLGVTSFVSWIVLLLGNALTLAFNGGSRTLGIESLTFKQFS